MPPTTSPTMIATPEELATIIADPAVVYEPEPVKGATYAVTVEPPQPRER